MNARGEPPAWLARGASPHELAAELGVDGDGLAATVARWNAFCKEGQDPDFGRGGDPDMTPNPNMGPLDEGPFYAVRVLAGTIGTKGGPVTDTAGAVLRPGDQVIRGLYAVGNTSAFWMGDAYPAPGATLAVGMTMGYLAGGHAARHLADGPVRRP